VPDTNTVFRDILKLVPWSEFDKLVKNHGSDELVHSSTTKRRWRSSRRTRTLTLSTRHP